jgi:hypothetical protein
MQIAIVAVMSNGVAIGPTPLSLVFAVIAFAGRDPFVFDALTQVHANLAAGELEWSWGGDSINLMLVVS